MYISLDFLRLEQHIDDVNQELKLAMYIQELLEKQYQISLETALYEPNMLRKQLIFIQNEINIISDRRQLLEKVINLFLDANKTVSDKVIELSHH